MNKIIFLGIIASLLEVSTALSCVSCPEDVKCEENLVCGPNQRKAKPACACCFLCQDIIPYGGECDLFDFWILDENRCADGLTCVDGVCQLPNPLEPVGPVIPVKPTGHKIIGPVKPVTIGPINPPTLKTVNPIIIVPVKPVTIKEKPVTLGPINPGGPIKRITAGPIKAAQRIKLVP